MRSRQTKHVLIMIFLLGIMLLSISGLFNLVNSSQQAPHRWHLGHHYDMGPVQSIEEIEDNLSGLTYQPETGLLYGVTNKPAQIVVLTKQGAWLRTIPLPGFHDTESIDHVSGDQFIIGEERENRVSLITIDDDTDQIDATEAEVLFESQEITGNRGIEGISWSEKYGLLMVQEEPARFIQHRLKRGLLSTSLENLLMSQFDARDFSGLAYIDEVQPKLLVLSDMSHSLYLLDLHGNELSSLRLGKGPFNFWPLMKQPEGVSVDSAGNIYIVGEPNQFLVLKRRSALPAAR